MDASNKGKLFVIDGTDGSGKNTQATVLLEALVDRYNLAIGKDIIKVSFPNYGNPGCTMVEKYLNGDFGSDPNKIDPYTSSMFYMIDRSISFMNDKWGEIYRNGGIVIADRYYTSNIIHQGAKILNNLKYVEPEPGATISEEQSVVGQFKTFIQWLTGTELNNIKLPTPDKIFWLMTDESSNTTMLSHRIKNDLNHKTDIHEADSEYLNTCRIALRMYKKICSNRERENILNYSLPKDMKYISEILSKDTFINVLDTENSIRTVDSISHEIMEYIVKFLALYGMYPESWKTSN